MPALAGLPDPRTLVALAKSARQPASGSGASRTAATLEIKCDRSAVLSVALAMIVEDKQAIRNQTRRPRDQGASRPSESLAGGGEMPRPDDEAPQPQPLAPEEAIPAPIPVPAEDAAPASAPTEDAVPGIPAADAAAVASAEDAAPDFFAAPDDPALTDDVALTEDSALADDDAAVTEVLRGGLRWSWELDFDSLLAALSEPAPWNRPVRLPPAKSAQPGGDTAPASRHTTRAVSDEAAVPASNAPSAAGEASAQDPAADPGAASAPDRSAGPSPIADRDSAGEPAPATSGPVPATVAPGPVPAPGSPTALDADSGSPPVPDSDSPGAVDPMDAEFAEMLEAIEVGGRQPGALAP